MRQRSAKTEALYREVRGPLVKRILGERQECEARVGGGVCTWRTVDVHEVLTRGRGGSICDPANLRAVCRACHRWIHEHPTEALTMGLLARSGPLLRPRMDDV